MITIWKFILNGGVVNMKAADTDIAVPFPAMVLSAGLDPSGQLCVWMLVETGFEKKKQRVYVRSTGHDCTDVAAKQFVGTVTDRSFIWHVFIDR